MRRAERRLRELERQQPVRGYRCFQQSADDPQVFRDAAGLAFSEAEIDALSAAGWQCVVICYHETPVRGDAIRLSWGEPGEQ